MLEEAEREATFLVAARREVWRCEPELLFHPGEPSAVRAIRPRSCQVMVNATCNCVKAGGANMSETRIIGTIAFSGDLNPDPSSAAVGLRKAGFEVTMMPKKFRSRLAHPEDYFIEASIDGTDDDKIVDAIMDEINAIVDGYGGLWCECGPMPPGYGPFEGIFDRRDIA
jgi:hypothetical protein